MPRISAYVSPFESLINRAPENGDGHDPSRRSILSLGGLLTGGLILPWAGSKALALVNPAAAADLAVVPTALPGTTELIAFRGALEALIGLPDTRTYANYDLAQATWSMHYHAVVAAAQSVWDMPVRTWSDVAARAEVAWTAAPKIERYEPPYPAVATLATGNGHDYPLGRNELVNAFSIRASAELIKAVMQLTGGEQIDIRQERRNRGL